MNPNYSHSIKTKIDEQYIGTAWSKDINKFNAEIIAMETDLIKLTSAYTLVTKFYIDSDMHSSDMIDRALASAPTYKNLLLPEGEYIIVRPIIIPDGISFQGVGNATVIKPDFSRWQGTDYRAIIIRGKEGSGVAGYNSYQRVISDFILTGVNSNIVKATGIFIGTDKVITFESAVNYGFINGIIRDIYVEKFDTAYFVKECWCSNLIRITAMYCRQGLSVHGKTVNVNFQTNFQNFDALTYGVRKYTTDITDKCIGIDIDAKPDYSNGSARPEGLFFLPGCLVYGADNDVFVHSVLQINFDSCMFDGAQRECVIVDQPDGCEFSNCYIMTWATAVSAVSCVELLTTAGANSKVLFFHNEIVGSTALYGIRANLRWNLDLIENDIQFFPNPIWINNCRTVKIINNHGHNNTGVFIYNQSYGDNSIVDGNISEDKQDIIHVQPTTATTFQIGRNSSGNSTTYFRGKVTIATNATKTTIAPFGSLTGLPAYIYPLVKFSVYNDVTHLISWTYNNGTGIITFTTATTSISPIVIYCKIMAMPSAAF